MSRALGDRVVGQARLGGGIDADTHAIALESGTTVVLRQPLNTAWDELDRHARVLETVVAHDVPAPRLLAVDATGGDAGRPSLLMSLLPGTARLPEVADDDYLRSLAQMAAALHSVTGPGLEWMGDRVDRVRTLVSEPPPRELDEPAMRAWEALGADPEALGESTGCLTHVDFWSGNTLRERTTVTGVIDWSNAATGRPEVDVAECAFDLSVSRGLAVGRRFIALYGELTESALESVEAWLAVCVVRSTDLAEWLPGWAGLGLDVASELAFQRRERVLEAALEGLRG